MDPLLIAFAGVAAAAAVTPGADTAVILRHAAEDRRAGLLTVAGVLSGLLVHASLAVAGLSAVLLTSATLFTVVKLAGAAYLLYLGVRALLAAVRSRPPLADEHAPAGPAARPAAAFRHGLLTNLLNPKTSLFFITLLPQFVPAGVAPIQRSVLLSAVLLAVAAAWYVVMALLVARIGAFLRRDRVRRALDALVGAVLVGLAGRIATTRR